MVGGLLRLRSMLLHLRVHVLQPAARQIDHLPTATTPTAVDALTTCSGHQRDITIVAIAATTDCRQMTLYLCLPASERRIYRRPATIQKASRSRPTADVARPKGGGRARFTRSAALLTSSTSHDTHPHDDERSRSAQPQARLRVQTMASSSSYDPSYQAIDRVQARRPVATNKPLLQAATGLPPAAHHHQWFSPWRRRICLA